MQASESPGRREGRPVRTAMSRAQRIGTSLLDVLPVSTADDAHALAELVALHGEDAVGHGQVEALRHASWAAWPRLAQVLQGLVDIDRTRRLVLAEGASPVRADRVASAVRRQAGWMLLAALEGSGGRTVVPAPLRAPLDAVLAAPWLPAAPVASGREGWFDVAVEEFQLACQEREAARERATVAAEIRRVVEASGVSQRAFARRLGTSGSRLSTYLNGHVVPSAAIMLRIKRVGRELASRQADAPRARRTAS